ncbi:MAG: DUF4835 family protein [Saprospiraceae bacterium]
MKKIFLFLCFSLILQGITNAQELNFNLSLNTQQATQADPKVFESLEVALKEFLNNQVWTDDKFEIEERIECNIQITLTKEINVNTFQADIAFQSTRPVYNSDYQTAMLTYVDKNVQFQYEAFQPIEFSDNQFNSNLTSVLAFYVYVILGSDYDSFSPFGGEKHYQKAQTIVNNVPPASAGRYKGWRSLDGNRNRYWLIESILSPRTRSLRQAMYDYHRLGLDETSGNVSKGRAAMIDALRAVEKVSRDYPNAMILQVFALAKGDEVVEVYKGGTRKEQNDAIRIMSRIDASSAAKYRKIRG